MTKRIIFCTGVIVALMGCDAITDPGDGDGDGDNVTIVGSGNVITQNRSVGNFDAISINGVARVVIEQSGESSLTLIGEDNLLEVIVSQVRDGQLVVGPPDGVQFRANHEIEYRITVAELTAIDISGVMNAEAFDVDTEDLRVDVSGVSTLRISGNADRQDLTVSGVTTYDASDLQSRDVSILGSGVMTVNLWVSDTLGGNVCGAGIVSYIGSPELQLDACPAVGIRKVGS